MKLPQDKLYKELSSNLINVLDWELYKPFYWKLRGQLDNSFKEPAYWQIKERLSWLLEEELLDEPL